MSTSIRSTASSYLSEAYIATDRSYDARVTVPVLWDKQTRARSSPTNPRTSCGCWALCSRRWPSIRSSSIPSRCESDIDALNDRIYENVNNAVYKAGFSATRRSTSARCAALFAMLDELDARLADRRFLFGPTPVETDWRLFTTLVRFDAVYQIHFKCSLRKLIEYEHLWPYARDLYQWPGVADTVDFDEIRRHYYLTHPMINPSGLVAVRPAASFDQPHRRADARVGAREPHAPHRAPRVAQAGWDRFHGCVHSSHNRLDSPGTRGRVTPTRGRNRFARGTPH